MMKHFMRRTWLLPEGVPSGQWQFLIGRQYLRWKWVFKFFKRRLFCAVFVQRFGLTTECARISDKHQRILWINWAAPSLGDSLMDLSARVLLQGRDITLLTHPKNAVLYMRDPIFQSVFSDPRALRKNANVDRFDLVICDAFSPRVLIKKLLVAPRTPFVGLYGYVNGFEVHRTLFAFARMKELLDLRVELTHPVRPTIGYGVDLPPKNYDVCIAVGGEWSFRTYRHWMAVVERLLGEGRSILLVGSQNGADLANSICARFPEVQSSVGRLDLSSIVREIGQAEVFIGADGGLWHVACALPIPTVVLFSDCQIFDNRGQRVTRETPDMLCESLYHETEVSQIEPKAVFAAFERLMHRLGQIDGSKSLESP